MRTPTMKIMIMKITIISIFAFLGAACGWSISPQLTVPRIGDKMTVLKIIEPSFSDSLELSPNFESFAVSGQYDMKFWPPSQSDTISSMVITGDRSTEYIRMVNDSLFVINRIKPGLRREFSSEPVYGYPLLERDSRSINSKGKTDAIGEYVTSGNHESEIIKGLFTITMEGDTLTDVECVKRTINETLIYNDSDTMTYRECSKTWYAPGYRYPFLWSEEGRLTDLNGILIDEISNWYMIEFAEQEGKIPEDPVNELIRNRYASRSGGYDYPSQGGDKRSDGTAPSDKHGPVNYNPDTETVIISPLFNDNSFKAYILCDIAGRVYSFGELGHESVRVSTTGYQPGTYLVHISTGAEPVVYKFIISAR